MMLTTPASHPAPPQPPRPPPLDAALLARRILELPPLPAALAEAMRVLSDDALPARHCVHAIEREPALALRVLQLANSCFYANSSRVGTLGDAVQLLGLRAVASVLAAVSIKQMLGRLPGALQAQDQRWRHALATGCAARELARERGLDADEAFVAGLLHDVGAWLLAAFAPDGVQQVQALRATEACDLCAAERRVLGVSHEEVGAQVAQIWRFPPDMAAAIAHHHQPRSKAEGATELEQLVHVADVLLGEPGDPANGPARTWQDRIQPAVWVQLDLDAEQLAATQDRSLKAFADLEQA